MGYMGTTAIRQFRTDGSREMASARVPPADQPARAMRERSMCCMKSESSRAAWKRATRSWIGREKGEPGALE